MVSKRSVVSLIGSLLLLGISGAGFAQGSPESAFPTKPIKIILPVGPGASDSLTRALAMQAEKILGQPIICENEVGGGRLLGLKMVASAKPDGYTLGLIMGSSVAWTPYFQDVPYDPLTSFTPIMSFGIFPGLISARSDAPFKTARELIEYSRTSGKILKFATPGTNNPNDVIPYIVAKQAGVQWKHVPFPSGIPAITALLGGHVDFVASGGEQAPYIREGTLTPLVTVNEKRQAAFPAVPTWVELGYPVFTDSRPGLIAPAGVPQPIIERLASAFQKAIDTKEWQEVADKMVFSKSYLGPAEFRKFNEEAIADTRKMLMSLDIPGKK